LALILIIETGGGVAGANTYISLADAETYFEGRLNKSVWSSASDVDKNAGLVQAARILDEYVRWIGWVTDTDQAMQWPRAGIFYNGYGEYYASWDITLSTSVYSIDDDDIPDEIKNAQCELAFVLLSQDTQVVAATAGFSSISVAGTVELDIDKQDRVSEIPSHVWRIISHLGNKKGGTKIQLLRG